MDKQAPLAKNNAKGEGIDDVEVFRLIAILGVFFIGLLGMLVVVILIRPAKIVRFGLNENIGKLAQKLELERTLPTEQYQELSVYLKSLKTFLAESDLGDSSLRRFGSVYQVFRDALNDGQITRSELASIRAAIWQSNIPVDTTGIRPKTNQSGMDSAEKK